MIQRTKNRIPTINIDGPEGNAFILMGYAKRYANQMGKDADVILSEMQSGDYINLLKTFHKYFNNVVILETMNPNYLNLDL